MQPLIKTTLLALSVAVSYNASAVTNLEFLRADSTGKEFFSAVELNVAGESGNYESENLHGSVVFAWDEGSGHFMTVFDHLWRRDEGDIEKNQSFFHIRYTKELSNKSGDNIEFFIQGQQDKFSNLESRIVGGIGYRKSLHNKLNNRKNAFGIGAFYESEKGGEGHSYHDEDVWRLNAYWHHKQPLLANTYVDNVLYIQPSLSDVENIRIHDELRLTTELSANASLGLNITYSYNSNPIGDIKNYNVSYGTFFKYIF